MEEKETWVIVDGHRVHISWLPEKEEE